MEYLNIIRAWLTSADAMLILTGAGMGVDSGLTTYRGEGGQWGQVENEQNQSVFELVNPQSLEENPSFLWTFFAERMKEYAINPPHHGFYILKRWVNTFNLDVFVLTSNIDGHFQKAGFDENSIREVHGALSHFQSTKPELSKEIWQNTQHYDSIFEGITNGIFPICPYSKVMARPNIYMFRDNTYIDTRSKEQEFRFQAFLERNKNKKMIVFEIGSGGHVQTIRMKTRMVRTHYNALVIRINPKQPDIKPPHIGIAQGALAALMEIDSFVR